MGLAVFPPDTRVPVAAITRYWAHARGRSPADTVGDIEQLAAAGVLQHQDGQIGFHDLQYDYLLLHAPTLSELHTALLDAYRGAAPDRGPDGGSEAVGWGGGGCRSMSPTSVIISRGICAGRGCTRSCGPRSPIRPIWPDGSTRRACTPRRPTSRRRARCIRPTATVVWWRGWLTRHAHLLAPTRTAADRERMIPETHSAADVVVDVRSLVARRRHSP